MHVQDPYYYAVAWSEKNHLGSCNNLQVMCELLASVYQVIDHSVHITNDINDSSRFCRPTTMTLLMLCANEMHV